MQQPFSAERLGHGHRLRRGRDRPDRGVLVSLPEPERAVLIGAQQRGNAFKRNTAFAAGDAAAKAAVDQILLIA